MASPQDDLPMKAVNGDRRALEELLNIHGRTVRQCLKGLIPPQWQAVLSEDDVMQETYADAAEHIAQFDSQHQSSFTKWLATIAQRNLQDALRMLEAEKRGGSHRRAETAPRDESWIALFELIGSSESTPSGHVARKEAVAALRLAMRRLPEAYAQVLTMHDLEGQPTQVVCAALKRSQGAMLMLRQRALRRLHEIMGTTSRYFSSQ